MALNPFFRLLAESAAPAVDYYPVVPTDNTNLPNGACRSLYIGTAGNVAVASANAVKGNTGTIVFLAVPAGTVLPINAQQVYASGTTAGNIIALY